MQSTYLGGMIIAGGLTFLPGRMNFEILFGESGRIGISESIFLGLGATVIVGIFALRENEYALGLITSMKNRLKFGG